MEYLCSDVNIVTSVPMTTQEAVKDRPIIPPAIPTSHIGRTPSIGRLRRLNSSVRAKDVESRRGEDDPNIEVLAPKGNLMSTWGTKSVLHPEEGAYHVQRGSLQVLTTEAEVKRGLNVDKESDEISIDALRKAKSLPIDECITAGEALRRMLDGMCWIQYRAMCVLRGEMFVTRRAKGATSAVEELEPRPAHTFVAFSPNLGKFPKTRPPVAGIPVIVEDYRGGKGSEGLRMGNQLLTTVHYPRDGEGAALAAVVSGDGRTLLFQLEEHESPPILSNTRSHY